MTKKRPVGVTILAILAVIAGVLAIFDTLRMLGLLPMFNLGPINFFGFSILGAILAGIMAAIWFWVAGRLWNIDPQGWLFVVVLAIVYLIFDAVALIGKSSFQALWPSMLVTGIILIYCLLPGVRTVSYTHLTLPTKRIV